MLANMACKPDSKSIVELIAVCCQVKPKTSKSDYRHVRGYTRECIRECNISVVGKGLKHRITFNVLQGKYTPILSLDASEGMGLLKIQDYDPLD